MDNIPELDGIRIIVTHRARKTYKRDLLLAERSRISLLQEVLKDYRIITKL